MNNFEIIAPLYDRLNKLIFWGEIQAAQRANLDRIKEGDHILIIGGGTGYVLEKIKAKNVSIDYVETSSRMLRKSQKRQTMAKVNFHQVPFENFQASIQYDIVIAHFFLDLFDQSTLESIIEKITHHLEPDGIVLVADFKPTQRIWTAGISRLMHVFFRLFAGLQSMSLKDIDANLSRAGFVARQTQFFYGGFIFSSVYSFKPQS